MISNNEEINFTNTQISRNSKLKSMVWIKKSKLLEEKVLYLIKEFN